MWKGTTNKAQMWDKELQNSKEKRTLSVKLQTEGKTNGELIINTSTKTDSRNDEQLNYTLTKTAPTNTNRLT